MENVGRAFLTRIGKNGSLTGYAGGIERKAALLDLEKKSTLD